MKRNSLLFATALLIGLTGCKNTPVQKEAWISNALDAASYQLKLTAEELSGTNKLPRSIYSGYDVNFLDAQLQRENKAYIDSLRPNPAALQLGQRHLCGISDWTSGFFPGSLWYAYEMTGDEELKKRAVEYTNILNPIRELKGTHDIGFMMNCSYGNANRLCPADSVRQALIQTADNLCGRFNPEIGCIRSWDFGKWNFPVIIDNMMNLDLLFYVSHLTGDDKYKELALRHAKTTMKNHFRDDYSSYHVVSYNDNGTVEKKCTHQGQNDASSWARGQAWGVYGYTSCYRESRDVQFLQQAKNIAALIMERVKTEDAIPLWDYDAPDIPQTPRDASAASITASALIELSTLTDDGQIYFDYAEKLLKNLSSDTYLAKIGTNQGFILMHSTGSLPNGSEIDTPINYADYYYLEALLRYMQVKGIDYKNI